VAEPFSDWTLQGRFPAGRPAWESAGARFVDDLEPFERRKLWLLNGAHTLLAAAAPMRGHSFVDEAFADPVLREWVEEFWDAASRHLPADLDLADYRSALARRFTNSAIRHSLEQIDQGVETKLRVRVVPVLLAELAAGADGAGAARPIAAHLLATGGASDPASALRELDSDTADAIHESVAAALDDLREAIDQPAGAGDRLRRPHP
jgi:fructuronate reductase